MKVLKSAQVGEGRLEVEGVAVGLLQFQQALVQALDDFCAVRVVGDVVHLERVALDVVQARLRDFRVKNELPVAKRHGALNCEIRPVNRLDARLGGLAAQQRHEALELHLRWALGPGDVQRCGHHVLQINRRVDFVASLDAGADSDERHVRAVLV